MKWLICLFKGHSKEYMSNKDFDLTKRIMDFPTMNRPWRCKRCGKYPNWVWWFN